ncbi:MAG: BatA domain-containing protein, partial [Bacillota bacterium]
MISESIQLVVPLAWMITPGFLWAGVLVMGIPILIHILNRRRYRVVQWAAMEYLLAALRKNRRKLRFEQIILLVTRCAVLGLLGLALARPMGCADSSIASLAGSRTGLHVFVIDNSYSMAYEADRLQAKTHLDQAKLLAKQQIDQLTAGGESVAVIAMARQAGSVSRGETSTGSKLSVAPGYAADANIVLRASYDLEAAKGAIDRIEQSYLGTDLVDSLQLAARLAREQRDQPSKHLYVFTDFTRSGWETRDSAALKPVGGELASVFGSHIRIHNLGRPGQWNYAVLEVKPDGNLVTNKFHTDFLANIKGYGAGGEAMVQWRWDDQVLGEGGRLRPDLATEIQRQTKAQVNEGGEHVLSVGMANEDKLKVDNTRARVIEVASELRVLIVE